ncbi:MAG: hypothetical protein AABY22_26390, partial [Nanoarchaeota archaeon]
MKTKNQPLRVKEGRTELTVVHEGQKLTFIHPPRGPGTYSQIEDLIEYKDEEKKEKSGLKAPTMAQTASLVYAAFFSGDEKVERYANEIKRILENNWLWGFTGLLYVLKKGAYIRDKPEVKNEMPYMNESDLVKKLDQKDPSVRFIPFGFKVGEQTPKQLEKNPFVIGIAGKEGAQKIAEIADKFKKEPYLGSFESVDREEIRVSALDSDWSSA